MGLQKETNTFRKAESVWKNIMRRMRDYPKFRFWREDSIRRQYLNQLRQNNRDFDFVQKALDDFLDRKREHFQRFFFLSNTELLHLISTAKNVITLLPHVQKVFDSIWTLELVEDTQVEAIVSFDGEKVPIKGCVLRSSEVEENMNQIHVRPLCRTKWKSVCETCSVMLICFRRRRSGKSGFWTILVKWFWLWIILYG